MWLNFESLHTKPCYLYSLFYLVISKSDKGKSTERFGDENIGDFSILHKELPQIVSGHVFCATTNKHLSAPQRLIRTLL